MRASEFAQRSLIIFDIDDTLFHTTAMIKVVNDETGEEKSLTNQQFNDYNLMPGERFDFGEFRSAEKFRNESVPIDPMLNRLKNYVSAGHHVVMLTARANFDDQPAVADKFAEHEIEINPTTGDERGYVHLYRAGELPGNDVPAVKKQIFVRRWLKTGKYNHVAMYDDSNANLKAFKDLQQEFPRIKFEAHHVSPTGSTRMIEASQRVQ